MRSPLVRMGVLFFVVIAITYLVARHQAAAHENIALQEVITTRWCDGPYGPGFYGVQVTCVHTASGYDVLGRVWIGSGNDMAHDLGKLGVVQSFQEAVEKWGRIEWLTDELVIGPGDPQPYRINRSIIQAHR